MNAITEAEAKTSWLDNLTLGGVGAVKTAEINGSSRWGAGVDLGLQLSPLISLHAVNYTFEGVDASSTERGKKKKKGGAGFGAPSSSSSEAESFGGLTIDETDLQLHFKFDKLSNEWLKTYAIAEVGHEWNDEEFGIGLGAGAALSLKKLGGFGKNLSLNADYTIRAQFSGTEDGVFRWGLNYSF